MGSADINLVQISYQGQLRSKPIRDNFTDIQNNYNALRAEVNAGIAATASEVTSARDGFGNLSDNLHARRGIGYSGVISGGSVIADTPASNIVGWYPGEAIVNGIGCDYSGSSLTSTIAAVTNATKNVVVINSNNAISVVLGDTVSTTDILPTITASQRPIAILSQDTSDPAVFAAGDIADIRGQGCYVMPMGEWFFDINDAIDFLKDVDKCGNRGGEIQIMQGDYYAKINLTAVTTPIKLKGVGRVRVYRPGDNYEAISIDVANVTVENINFYGNGMAGSKPLCTLTANASKTIFKECSFDANSASSATYKTIDDGGNALTGVYIINCQMPSAGTIRLTKGSGSQWVYNTNFERITYSAATVGVEGSSCACTGVLGCSITGAGVLGKTTGAAGVGVVGCSDCSYGGSFCSVLATGVYGIGGRGAIFCGSAAEGVQAFTTFASPAVFGCGNAAGAYGGRFESAVNIGLYASGARAADFVGGASGGICVSASGNIGIVSTGPISACLISTGSVAGCFSALCQDGYGIISCACYLGGFFVSKYTCNVAEPSAIKASGQCCAYGAYITSHCNWAGYFGSTCCSAICAVAELIGVRACGNTGEGAVLLSCACNGLAVESKANLKCAVGVSATGTQTVGVYIRATGDALNICSAGVGGSTALNIICGGTQVEGNIGQTIATINFCLGGGGTCTLKFCHGLLVV